MADDSITLRLDGEQISVRLLYQKIGVFLDVLQEVDRSVTAEIEEGRGENLSVKWTVASIHSGSPVEMTLHAVPVRRGVGPAIGDRIIAAVETGLLKIQSPQPMRELPPHFSFPILEHVHTLIRPGADDIKQIVVRTPEYTVTLSKQAEHNLERFLSPRFEHYGSVEGILQMVSVAGRTPHFSVRDHLTGLSVRCSVPSNRITEVIAAFNRRVSIDGRVRTNELGDVLSIHMHTLRTFPPDEELPDIEDVAGIFDLTMGKSLAEHIKSLRDVS